MATYQAHHNYLSINEHIHLVENTPLTEDRLYQYKGHFDFIRLFFHDFRLMNPEIGDWQFRDAAWQSEIYADSLEQEFNTETYKKFLYVFQYMADRVMEEEEMSKMLETTKLE